MNEWDDLKNTIRVFSIWAITTTIDSIFLVIWVSIQWLVNNKVITLLLLTGIDKIVLLVFQLLFAISTLAPVGITIYKDISLMVLRTQRIIRREKSIDNYHEPD